ncbi:DUF4181 domain-containing protein [Sporosarcina sp. ITBMC105]
MYGIDPFHWLKLILLIIIIVLAISLFNLIMQNLLKVKKRSSSSYHHINKQHKMIDWTLRIACIGFLFFAYFINIGRIHEDRDWFLKSTYVVFVLIALTELTRAFFEWKYDENKKAYLLTISQLGFGVMILIVLFTTDFFGWLG